MYIIALYIAFKYNILCILRTSFKKRNPYPLLRFFCLLKMDDIAIGRFTNQAIKPDHIILSLTTFLLLDYQTIILISSLLFQD